MGELLLGAGMAAAFFPAAYVLIRLLDAIGSRRARPERPGKARGHVQASRPAPEARTEDALSADGATVSRHS
jgi:hypothetical protein